MSERKDIPANPNSTEGHTAADQLPGGCETCDGTGYAWFRSVVAGGWSVQMPCVDCDGTGDPQ